MRRSLGQILTLARAGANSRAWDNFVAGGLADVTDDPAALTLKGRLFKDQARKARGEAKIRFYLRSANAYADAAALRSDSYPLINAATMSLFAGQSDNMALLAQQVLALLDAGTGTGETPYWHDATKAEALLLLGQRAEAETALREARGHAPQAWEDHATTLRQFRAILSHRQQPHDWLAAYAPPKSIYYKGMMGIAPDDQHAAHAISGLVAETGARFAFGALAAGADILIAEAVVRGAGELHVILPVSPSVFKAASVAPYGDDWLPRFDALLDQAISVEIVDNGDRLSSAAIHLAAGVAKGRAIDNAERLESEAIPVEVADPADTPATTGIATTLTLSRSAAPRDSIDIEERQLSLLVATNGETVPQDSTLNRHGELAIAVADRAGSSAGMIRQLRAANPEATIAVHALIADSDGFNGAAAVQVERLVKAAAPGTIIATSSAAMLMKAVEPDLWIEPLGELPDPSGALSIYALGISI